MEKNIEIGILYQFYKDLLSDKQSDTVEQYYIEDLSLTEIAENLQISKQAVSNNLKRAERDLLDFEEKLQLYGKSIELTKSLEDLDKLIKKSTDDKSYISIHEEISSMISKLN